MSIQISEMSKTYQYRKVMKPMLERKRRARINKCLDELKDLMVATLESEGEHVTRLEKADILELTVTHLQKLKQQRKVSAAQGGNAGAMSQAEGFRSGYIHAVNEVSRSLSELPGVNVNLGTQLMTHLGQRLNQLQPPVRPALPVTTPISVHINNPNYRSQILQAVQQEQQQQLQQQEQRHRGQEQQQQQPRQQRNTIIRNTTSTTGYLTPISPASSGSGSSLSGSREKLCSGSLLTTCRPIISDKDNNNLQLDATNIDDIDVDGDSELDEDDEENVWRPW